MTSPATSPATSTGRNQFTATVAANIPLCREHYRLVLTLPEFPETRPGQFIQITGKPVDNTFADDLEPLPEDEWRPGGYSGDAQSELASIVPVLRRPFSLAGRRKMPHGIELDIIHRVVGISTAYFASLTVGESVGILGPLGNSFTLPKPTEIALLIGGGVGIPPMIYLAPHLARSRAVAFAGALTKDLLPLAIGIEDYDVGEFSPYGIPTILTTDDGSFGYRGFVTQALEEFLDGTLAPEIGRNNLTPHIYTCGPEPMMKRVADIALSRNIPCQIAVERAMACGMGTCQSCCIKVKKPDPAQPPLPGNDWCYRLACTDGPVFTARQLLW